MQCFPSFLKNHSPQWENHFTFQPCIHTHITETIIVQTSTQPLVYGMSSEVSYYLNSLMEHDL